MKPKSTKTDEQEPTILSVFLRRKQSFMESLQKILLSTSNDRFIKQMFEDKNSAMFVPDRVCELIERYLTDDREKYIQELYGRIRSIEACFGPKKEREIESIGTQILEEIDTAKITQNKNNEKIRNLRQSLNKIALGQAQSREIEQLKKKIQDIEDFVKEKKSEIQLQQKTFQREILQARRLVNLSIESTHSDMINKTEDAIAGYKTTEKTFKRETTRMQKKHQEEIDQHLKNEEKLNKDIGKLNAKNQRLTQKNSELQNEIEKLRGEVSHLEYVTDQSMREDKSIEEYETEIRSLKSEINSKNLQIQSLMESNLSTSEMDTSLQTALAKARNLINKRNEQVQKLKSALKDLSGEYDNISHELSMAKADQELTDAKLAKVTTLERERDEYIDKVNELETSRSSLEMKLEASLSNIEQLTTENTRMKRLMKDSSVQSAKFADLISQNDELREKIEANKGKLSSQKNEINELRGRNIELQDKYDDAAQKTRTANDQIEKLKSEIDAMSQTLLEGQKTISDLHTAEKQNEININDLKSRLLQTEKQKNETKEALDQSEEKIREITQKYNDSIDEINQLKIENAKVTDDLNTAKSSIKQKEAVINNFVLADQEEKETNNKIIQENEELQNKIKEINSQFHNAQRQLKVRDQESQIKDSKIEKLKGKLSSWVEANKQLKQNAEENEKRISSLTLQVKQMQRNIDTVKDQNQSLRERFATAKTEATDATTKLQKVTADSSANEQKYKTIVDKTASELESLKKQLEAAQSENHSLCDRVASQTAQIEAQDLKLQDLQKQLKRNQEDMNFEQEKHQREMKRKDDQLAFEQEKNDKTIARSKELLNIEKTRSDEEQTRLKEQFEKDKNTLERKVSLAEKRVNEINALMKENEKKLHDEIESLNDKIATLKLNNDKLKRELKENSLFTAAIAQAAGAQSIEDIKSAIEEITKKADEGEDLINHICSIFNIKDKANVINELQGVKRALSDLQKKYNTIKSIYPDCEDSNLASTVLETKKAIDSIQALFPSTPIDEISQDISERLDILKSISTALNVDDPSKIQIALSRLQQQLEDSDEINKAMLESAGAKTQDEFNARVSKLRDLENEMKELVPNATDPIKELRSLKEKYEQLIKLLDGEERAYERIQELNELEKITKDIGTDGSTPLEKLKKYISAHNKLVEENTQIVEIISNEYGNDLVSAIENLRKDLGSAADLFQRLFAVLAEPTAQPVNLSFPIKDSVRDHFIELISQFKVRTEDTTTKINTILNEARKDGYMGSDILEAVKFISETRGQEAKEKASEEFTTELSTVQQNLEMINKQSEIDKERMRKKIDELTQNIEKEKMRNFEKEKQLLSENEEQKKIARNSQLEIETEKKIREELIRIIEQKSPDTDFLKSHLNQAEIKAIKKANVQI